MELQPNNWSCLMTAAANLLEISNAKMVELIGHDGSEIVFPELSEPYNRRNFHVQEIVTAALKIGTKLIFLSREIYGTPHQSIEPIKLKEENLETYLTNRTVLLGKRVGKECRHAVTWNGRDSFFDPNSGEICPLNQFLITAILF